MTFNGIDGQTVELKIINYQYPDINDGDWDGNWLNIYLNVKSKVGHWQTVDPSLTTWDVQRLINWFDTLSKNLGPEDTDISFTEPNLSFEVLNDFNSDKTTVRIKFDLESRPQSAKDDKEYFVDLIADSNELKRLSTELKNELEKYPERKPAHNSTFPKAGHSWWKKIFGSE
ncbi:WapI family immunity protein [Pedobacter sp.]